jgi:hypothetical protein
MSPKTLRSVLWILSIVVLPSYLYASCPNNCGTASCPSGNCSGGVYPNCDPGCSSGNGECQCWMYISDTTLSCQACQYQFSCWFSACENFDQIHRYMEMRGCYSDTVYNSGYCDDLIDLNNGVDCC